MVQFSDSDSEILQTHIADNYDLDLALALSRVDILKPEEAQKVVAARIFKWLNK